MSLKSPTFGGFLRERRERLAAGADGHRFSLRQVAERVGFQPAYLSKIERDLEAPPSEEKIIRLAGELAADPDVLLAMAGKVSSDLREAICRRSRPRVGFSGVENAKGGRTFGTSRAPERR